MIMLPAVLLLHLSLVNNIGKSKWCAMYIFSEWIRAAIIPLHHLKLHQCSIIIHTHTQPHLAFSSAYNVFFLCVFHEMRNVTKWFACMVNIPIQYHSYIHTHTHTSKNSIDILSLFINIRITQVETNIQLHSVPQVVIAHPHKKRATKKKYRKQLQHSP